MGFGRHVISPEDFTPDTGLNLCCGNALFSISGSDSLWDSESESVTFSLHLRSISVTVSSQQITCKVTKSRKLNGNSKISLTLEYKRIESGGNLMRVKWYLPSDHHHRAPLDIQQLSHQPHADPKIN